MNAMEAKKARQEKLFLEILDDISACGRIGGMMDGLKRELEMLEWNKEECPTVNGLLQGWYTHALGRSIQVLAERAEENLNLYSRDAMEESQV